MKQNSLDNWVHGNVVCALLHLDEGRVLTAARSQKAWLKHNQDTRI